MVAPDEPVPLSADDVAALVRGEMSEERIERLLAAREVSVDPEPSGGQRPQLEGLERPEAPGRPEKPEAPMEISDKELEALSTGREGREVEAVNKRLEELRGDQGGDSGGNSGEVRRRR